MDEGCAADRVRHCDVGRAGYSRSRGNLERFSTVTHSPWPGAERRAKWDGLKMRSVQISFGR